MFALRAEQDLSLDEVCTDVLYSIPWKSKVSDKVSAFDVSGHVSSFRQRHPNVRLHISIEEDSLDRNTLSQEADRLISYLKRIDSSGLDVFVNSRTNLFLLSQVLRDYQRILYSNYLGLSITVESDVDIRSIVNHTIDGLVDSIFVIPSVLEKSSREEFNFSSLRGLTSNKLVIGLPSVVFDTPNSRNHSTVPSLNDLCQGLNFSYWKPRIKEDNQVSWHHFDKNLTFVMQTGQSVENKITSIFKTISTAGVLLFDVSFGLEKNPVCSRHRELFVNSIHKAAARLGYGNGRRIKRVPNEESLLDPTKLRVKVVEEGSRLGKLLVFAVGNEDIKFKEYYNIYDEKTLLQSPVIHVELGYDESGKIYDMHKQMPHELSQEMVSKIIHLHFIDKILSRGGAGIFGFAEQGPPSLLIYPKALNLETVIPFLVSWVPITSQTVELVPRKVRKPYSSTTTSTTTEPNVVRRLCTDGQNNRCFIPAGLMEILDLDIRPSTTTTTTRKPTSIRPTTAKPEVPVNPIARPRDGTVSASASSLLTLSFLTLPPLIDKNEIELESRLADPYRRRVVCNWESKHSYLSCKTRNRRFVNKVRKQKTVHTSLMTSLTPRTTSDQI